MKEFLLVRHAKSSWKDAGLMDEERPLNKRGHRDAPRMIDFLIRRSILPSHLISSPAVRAFTTAQYFFDALDSQGDVMIWKENELYMIDGDRWLALIQETDSSISFPAFFSHNPAISYFANRFTDNFIENVPTCGVVHLRSSADNWEDVAYDNTVVVGKYFPKTIESND